MFYTASLRLPDALPLPAYRAGYRVPFGRGGAGVRVSQRAGSEGRRRPLTGGNQMSEKRKRATGDELNKMLAAMRAAGTTAPRSRRDGPGTLRVAAGDEGFTAG